MKKVLLILACLLMLTGCSKKEYVVNEELNYLNDIKSISANMSGYGTIDGEHMFNKVTFKETLRIIDEKASGVLYYGYPSCPFCQQAVPILNKVALELNLPIYYFDTSSEQVSEDTLNQLYAAAGDYFAKENGEYVFYVPLVLVVKNGEVVAGHRSLVDGANGELSTSQQNELYKIYQDMLLNLCVEK